MKNKNPKMYPPEYILVVAGKLLRKFQSQEDALNYYLHVLPGEEADGPVELIEVNYPAETRTIKVTISKN